MLEMRSKWLNVCVFIYAVMCSAIMVMQLETVLLRFVDVSPGQEIQ